jgi:hypothetical protein
VSKQARAAARVDGWPIDAGRAHVPGTRRQADVPKAELIVRSTACSDWRQNWGLSIGRRTVTVGAGAGAASGERVAGDVFELSDLVEPNGNLASVAVEEACLVRIRTVITQITPSSRKHSREDPSARLAMPQRGVLFGDLRRTQRHFRARQTQRLPLVRWDLCRRRDRGRLARNSQGPDRVQA